MNQCKIAYEVKTNCCPLGMLFKVKNGIFLLGISFFFSEIITFLYYANEESDDVIGGSSNFDTRDVHHKRNKMTPTMLLPWQHSWFQSLSVKYQISPFAIF